MHFFGTLCIQLIQHLAAWAKCILDNNQYFTNFYKPIISGTINRILIQLESDNSTTESNEEEEAPSHLVFLQYRRKPNKDYVQSLKRLCASCKVMRKLKHFIIKCGCGEKLAESCHV